MGAVGTGGGRPPRVGTVTASVFSANETAGQANDPLDAELAAYNHAFCELELPWRWDAHTLRHLLSIAADRDVVGTYVERSQAHLLRAYEKAFLRDLVHSARERYRQENCGAPS
jgi:hypothetical protein